MALRAVMNDTSRRRYFVPKLAVLLVGGIVEAATMPSIPLILTLFIYLGQAMMSTTTTVPAFAKPAASIPWCLVIEAFVLAL